VDEIGARDRTISRTVRLVYEYGQPLDLVAPAGSTVDGWRSGLVVFGPLTCSVIASLWNVGLPARAEELEDLRNAARRALGSPREGNEHVPNIRQALVLWRVLAALSQLLEELAALTSSLDRWHEAGYPRGLRCQIGEHYLKWDTQHDGGIVNSLMPWRDAQRVFGLLCYPSVEEARIVLNAEGANRVHGLAAKSAELAATDFRASVEAATPALRRTFVRHKHRITATSPGFAPIWLPKRGPDERALIEEKFRSGFGVFDWQPRAADSELVLWQARDDDLVGQLTLLTKAFALFSLVLASVARFILKEVDALPLLIPPDSELTDEDRAAIADLQQGNYRSVAIARRHGGTHESEPS